MDDLHLSGLHVSEDYGIAESSICEPLDRLSEPLDRLSELPDPVILLILSLLPKRDVVITTFLSKRWKDLWVTIPCLDFCNWNENYELYFTHESYDLDKFRRFVCGALALWKGTKILRLSISFRFDNLFSSEDVLDSWLLFAIEKQVEELYINLSHREDPFLTDNGYCAPQLLCSCSSLKKLSLVCCQLEIGESVQWNQLKSLTIESAESFCELDMNQIISSAPQLEILNLFSVEIRENLNIQSSSLKMLKLSNNEAPFSLMDLTLTISAPNLETIEISGATYGRCLLNIPSLTNASLGDGERDDDRLLLNCLKKNLSGSPRLEILNLRIRDSLEMGEKLNIRSSSLKMVKVERYSDIPDFMSGAWVNNTMLGIWAPNLETLEISGISWTRCLLNVPSLTNAVLVFRDRVYRGERYIENILLEKMVRHVLLRVCHVAKVTLSDWSIKVVLAMKKKGILIPFSNAKFIKLYAGAADEILGVLDQMFPKLMMLVVERNDLTSLISSDMTSHIVQEAMLKKAKEPSIIKFDSCDSSGLRTSFPSLSVPHLRTVEITWHLHDTSIIQVIEILLENAHMLERMVFCPISAKPHPKSLSLAEEKV